MHVISLRCLITHWLDKLIGCLSQMVYVALYDMRDEEHLLLPPVEYAHRFPACRMRGIKGCPDGTAFTA